MKNPIFKSSITLIFGSIFIKFLGLMRDILFASYLGTSNISDAYILGISISQIVIAGFAGYFTHTYISNATSQLKIGESNLNSFTKEILVITLFLFLSLSFFILFFSESIVSLIGYGAKDEVLTGAIFVTKFTSIPSAFFVINSILVGYFNVKRNFIVNFIYPLLFNLLIIFSILIFGQNLFTLAIAYNLSLLISSFLYFLLSRIKFSAISYKPSLKVSNNVINTIYITLPLLFGGLVLQLNELADRTFATFFGVGVLSALRYGKAIQILIISIFSIPISQVAFPYISSLAKDKNIISLSKLISKLLTILILFYIPIMFSIPILNIDIVKVLFYRGTFNQDSLGMTAIAFLFYSISILSVSFNELLSRVYFAFNETKRPISYSVISMALNISLNIFIVFTFKFEYFLLAFTTSFSEILLSILYLINLKKFNLSLIVSTKLIFASFFSAIFMVFSLVILKNNFTISNFAELFLVSLIGFIVYLSILLLTSIKNLKKALY